MFMEYKARTWDKGGSAAVEVVVVVLVVVIGTEEKMGQVEAGDSAVSVGFKVGWEGGKRSSGKGRGPFSRIPAVSVIRMWDA